jgi:PE-PPE domain
MTAIETYRSTRATINRLPRRRVHSGPVVRSVCLALLAVFGAILLILTPTVAPLFTLTGVALIMGGTGHPLSVPPETQSFVDGYVAIATDDYIAPSGLCGATCTPVAVVTPEQFFPTSGDTPFDQSVAEGVTALDTAIAAYPGEQIVVYGYSQSATVSGIEKQILATAEPTAPVSFILIENLNRPNGGILERYQGLTIPALGLTFNGATPTNTNFTTVDVTHQYDGLSDSPNYPIDALADVNAFLGAVYVHPIIPGSYDPGTPVLQDKYGDTTYYVVATNRLPLLLPAAQLGVPDPILAVADAPLRVLVEAGYSRTISPGAPTPASLMPAANPITVTANVLTAIPTGLDDGLQEVGLGRPFGTTPAGPYGVGGPPVTMNPLTAPGPTPAVSVNSAHPTNTARTQPGATGLTANNSRAAPTTRVPPTKAPTLPRTRPAAPRIRDVISSALSGLSRSPLHRTPPHSWASLNSAVASSRFSR